jgi:hypothetical protein
MANLKHEIGDLRQQVTELKLATGPELKNFLDRAMRESEANALAAAVAEAYCGIVKQFEDVLQDTRDRLATVEELVRRLDRG